MNKKILYFILSSCNIKNVNIKKTRLWDKDFIMLCEKAVKFPVKKWKEYQYYSLLSDDLNF